MEPHATMPPRAKRLKIKASTPAANVPQPNCNSPLLSLPGELRNEIYALVLYSDQDAGAIYIDYVEGKPRGKFWRKKLWAFDDGVKRPQGPCRPNFAAIIVTNKQANKEASAYLYGENHFRIYDLRLATRFFRDIGSNVRYIRDIYIQDIARTLRNVGLHPLAELSSLQKLRLETNPSLNEIYKGWLVSPDSLWNQDNLGIAKILATWVKSGPRNHERLQCLVRGKHFDDLFGGENTNEAKETFDKFFELIEQQMKD